MLCKAFLMDDLVDAEINNELNLLSYTIDRNQLVCQQDRRVCEIPKEFQIRGKIVRSLTNQSAIRKVNMDISEVRRRVDARVRSRAFPAMAENGWHGRYLAQEFQERRGRGGTPNATAYREIDRGERGFSGYRGKEEGRSGMKNQRRRDKCL